MTTINGLVPNQAVVPDFKLDQNHPLCDIWRNLFFRTLRQVGTLAATCEVLGLRSVEVRKLLITDQAFSETYQSVLQDTKELLEAEVLRRAMNGSDVLLMFALKKLDPSYKEQYQAPSSTTINVKTYVGFDPDAWDKRNGKTISVNSTQVLDITPTVPLLEEKPELPVELVANEQSTD